MEVIKSLCSNLDYKHNVSEDLRDLQKITLLFFKNEENKALEEIKALLNKSISIEIAESICRMSLYLINHILYLTFL